MIPTAERLQIANISQNGQAPIHKTIEPCRLSGAQKALRHHDDLTRRRSGGRASTVVHPQIVVGSRILLRFLVGGGV